MEIEQSWIVLDRKLKPTGSGKICERKGKIDIIKNSNIKTNRKTETKVDKLRWYENDGNKKLRWMDDFKLLEEKLRRRPGKLIIVINLHYFKNFEGSWCSAIVFVLTLVNHKFCSWYDMTWYLPVLSSYESADTSGNTVHYIILFFVDLSREQGYAERRRKREFLR